MITPETLQAGFERMLRDPGSPTPRLVTGRAWALFLRNRADPSLGHYDDPTLLSYAEIGETPKRKTPVDWKPRSPISKKGAQHLQSVLSDPKRLRDPEPGEFKKILKTAFSTHGPMMKSHARKYDRLKPR